MIVDESRRAVKSRAVKLRRAVTLRSATSGVLLLFPHLNGRAIEALLYKRVIDGACHMYGFRCQRGRNTMTTDAARIRYDLMNIEQARKGEHECPTCRRCRRRRRKSTSLRLCRQAVAVRHGVDEVLATTVCQCNLHTQVHMTRLNNA